MDTPKKTSTPEILYTLSIFIFLISAYIGKTLFVIPYTLIFLSLDKRLKGKAFTTTIFILSLLTISFELFLILNLK